MKALSIRSPWWWFIIHGGKPVENRDWSTRFRGTVAVHASKWWRTVECLEIMRDFSPLAERAGAPRVTMEDVRPHCGHIVGTVDIVDCITASDNPWFFGDYGFVLRNPVALPRPIPCKGMLGFFHVPSDVEADAMQQIQGGAP